MGGKSSETQRKPCVCKTLERLGGAGVVVVLAIQNASIANRLLCGKDHRENAALMFARKSVCGNCKNYIGYRKNYIGHRKNYIRRRKNYV